MVVVGKHVAPNMNHMSAILIYKLSPSADLDTLVSAKKFSDYLYTKNSRTSDNSY